MSEVYTAIILDTRRPLNDHTYPVKLRVTYLRKRKYYPTVYNLNQIDFTLAKGEKPKGIFKEMQVAFQAIETKAIQIINKLNTFTFEGFEKRFLSSADRTDVFDAYKLLLEKLEKEDRIGTMESYETAKNSLIGFVKKIPPVSNKGMTKEQIAARKELFTTNVPRLPFTHITVEFLKEYGKWMKKYGRSRTTIGFYLRPLRALFNEAIEAGDVDKELYPFDKKNYKIPASQNIKKALDKDGITLIYNYRTEVVNELWGRDIWMLTYFANGINMADIARLKFENLHTHHIIFIRAKTQETKDIQKPIVINRTPYIDSIINRWANSDKLPGNYVFPILEIGMDAQEQHNRIKAATKKVNKYVGIIAEKVGLEVKPKTYAARHSNATIMKAAGVSLEDIGDLLGHETTRSTKNYVDSILNNRTAELTTPLTSFLQESDPLANALKDLLSKESVDPQIRLTCIKSMQYEGGEIKKGRSFLFQNNNYLENGKPNVQFISNSGPYIYLNKIAELLSMGIKSEKLNDHFKAEIINNLL